MILTLDRAELADWFDRRLRHVRCGRDTRAYLTSLMTERLTATGDMSDESVVLAYHDARNQGRFEDFQRIGDWVVWTGIIVPAYHDEHGEVYESIGRLSYYACYRILQRQWTLYEELADELPRIVDEIRRTSDLALEVKNHPHA